MTKRVAIDTSTVTIDNTRRYHDTTSTRCNVKRVKVTGRYPLIEMLLMRTYVSYSCCKLFGWNPPLFLLTRAAILIASIKKHCAFWNSASPPVRLGRCLFLELFLILWAILLALLYPCRQRRAPRQT